MAASPLAPAIVGSASERHSHRGTPSSGTARSASGSGTPALRKYFCAMMSTATCDQVAGITRSATWNTVEPSGLTMRDSRRSKAMPS